MWLIEDSPDEDGVFLPVNIDHIQYINIDINEKKTSWCVKFCLGQNNNSKWIMWWFLKEADRDKYYQKILKKLPRIDLEINDITL